MVLDNDTRGWIMTCVSGVACILGASIICVDIIIRKIPGREKFDITDSNAFLSCSLSLSFGVMLFSSLYSMLPHSKDYLEEGGYSPQAAAWMLIGLFLVGVVGIQSLSRALHHYIPSHIVDCDHTHDEELGHEEMEEQRLPSSTSHNTPPLPIFRIDSVSEDSENTPLLSREAVDMSPPKTRLSRAATVDIEPDEHFQTAPTTRRPSVLQPLTRKISSFVAGGKAMCDENGSCQGYSEPCGQDCFKAVARRATSFSHFASRHPTFSRSGTGSFLHGVPPVPEGDEELAQADSGETSQRSSANGHAQPILSRSHSTRVHHALGQHPSDLQNGDTDPRKRGVSKSDTLRSSGTGATAPAHHHHVPTNAFLSIGLQTSLAIALHKLPEGFITYATNHANPTLGFAVFMALFIHNITEGFAMALPLYLALNNRFQAMFWSSLLGGASQPLGAGLAALWFKLAGGGNMAPGERVYGGMFAVTAGIMTSVALQLFSESLGLTHNRNMCTLFAFLGMGILGFSFALTA